MRNLMRDDFFKTFWHIEAGAHLVARSSAEEAAGEDNRARVFHAAELRGANNQSEFLVRIRRDGLAKEGECRRRRRETFRGVITIALRNVVKQIGGCVIGRVDYRAFINGDDHAIWWDGFRFFKFPVRRRRVSCERDELSIGDNLVTLGRRNCKRDSCLCRRMIESWDPVVNSIWPVVAGGGDLSIGVLRENQSILWMAVIVNRDF